MTQKEQIRAKIERLYDGEAPKHDQQCDFGDGYFTGLSTILNFIDSLPEEKPIEKDEEMEALIACDIMEATVKRVNIDKQDKDKEEEAMLEKIAYLRELGIKEEKK